MYPYSIYLPAATPAVLFPGVWVITRLLKKKVGVGRNTGKRGLKALEQLRVSVLDWCNL